MAKLMIEEVIGIADEVIPMWRKPNREQDTILARYAVIKALYDLGQSEKKIAILLSKSRSTIYNALSHSKQSYDNEYVGILNNAISQYYKVHGVGQVEFECIDDSEGTIMAGNLMQRLKAKECRIDYVNGKIRVRYVEQAED